jgi:poly(A) polymerase
LFFPATSNEKELFELLRVAGEQLGVPVYLVGGYVRDKLLRRPCTDVDVVCVGSGVALAERVAELMRPRPKVAVFRQFGTAMLRFRDLEVEFVGARRESYRSDSRKPLVEDGTLEDDQNRRDFTINALAISLNAADYGQIIDPFGGIEHLEQGLLKTPLDPAITYSDDPLRMMRAIRFASQLHFRIDEASLSSIADQCGRIRIVSQERVTVELEKILASPQPSIGFRLLFETGLLHLIFPEMVALQGVHTQDGYQHKDNFFHTLKVVDNIARKTDNIWLRWAAVLHDIGKPATKRYDAETGWTFHGHEMVGAKMVPHLFKKLRLPLDHKMRYVQNLVRLHQRPIQLTKEEITDSAMRRLIVEAGDDLEDLFVLCTADITSRNKEKVARYLENYEFLQRRVVEVEEKDHLRNWQPPITGEIIMETFGLRPSPQVGEIKTAVREAILDGVVPNEFEPAFAHMLEIAAGLGLKPVKDVGPETVR